MKLFQIFLFSIIAMTNVFAQDLNQRSGSDIEKEVTAVLNEYLASFNSQDIHAWERTMHFPHYRLASGSMSVQSGPGELPVEAVRRLVGEDWDHSTWETMDFVHLSELKVHVDTKFARHREDGSIMGMYDSLYILTKENGRWGVKMRSSFAR